MAHLTSERLAIDCITDRLDRLDQENLDPTACRFLSREPGRNHFGVVQDDQRTAAQEARQIPKKAVIALAVIFAKNEQSRCIPVRYWMRRDQPLGQFVVKVVRQQEYTTSRSQHAYCQHKIKPS